MAVTVNWDGLRELAGFNAEKGRAISVYVCLDPSVTPTPADANARVRSLLDEGGKSAGATRPDLTHDQRQALRSDFERIRHFFEQDFARNGAHGFALFASGLDNFWSPLALTESVADGIKVGRQLYLAPLVPLVGRGEGAIVCVAGRERGQLYRLRAGRLEEIADQSEEQPRRHDQGGLSQARLQRHIDHLAEEHLRKVADELDRRVRQLRAQRVVVVASEETRAELEPLLGSEVRHAVIGWTQAEAHAGPPELLEAAAPVLERWRGEREREAVERWSEEAGRNGRAVSGWGDTLEAASDGRIDLLLFREGVDHQGWQCPACGRGGVDRGTCPLDGTLMEESDVGLDLAVHQTLSHGGTVWAVRNHDDLEPAEGVGALLRY
jgi:Bacterial archaeo-eukaryotic release factor family 10